MKRERALKKVSGVLRESFGRLLAVRDVRRVRRVSGDAWVVTVVLAASSGDLHVSDLTVDDDGTITPTLGPDHVVEAVIRAERFLQPSGEPAGIGDFGDVAGEAEEPALDAVAGLEEPVDVQVTDAIARGDAESLLLARSLLPRLLADPDNRGATLFTMAGVELKLGEISLVREYLEAAAREFADRFDLPALERVAGVALGLESHAAFAGSPIHQLLEQSRARLTPLDDLFAARGFTGLSEPQRAKLAAVAELRTLAAEEMLVTEGEPARSLFVVKSGLLGVWLENPTGGSRLVRCCFPGWLLGESSVLGASTSPEDSHIGPRCTASLRAERVSEVWVLPAETVSAIMVKDPIFARRIADTKHTHRLDSFFSMHATMGQLDANVRDEVLSCFQRLENFDEETVLLRAGTIPEFACLVARGSVGLYAGPTPDDGGDTPAAVVEADSFYGVRDAIHQIAPNLTAIARPGSTVALFDAVRLRELCDKQPEHVAAVLERLG